MFFNKYPYTDNHELNLDWIISKVKELNKTMDEWTVLNRLTWRGVWDIGESYPQFSIVDDNHNGYVSIKPVPRNVEITNADYWKLVAGYDALYSAFEQRITNLENANIEVNEKINSLENADIEVSEKINMIENKIDNASKLSVTVGEIGALDTTRSDYMNGGFSVGNIFYQYYISNSANGFIHMIDMNTGVISEEMGNIPFYHGNDFTVINDTVYCAPYNDNNNTPINKILYASVSDLSNVRELDVFGDTGYNCLFGIDKLDDNTLLCALRTYGYDKINDTHFYTYKLDNGAISELPINWNNFYISPTQFPHPIIVIDGVLYMTASYENGIYTFDLTDNGITCIDYKTFPMFSPFGHSLNELESIGIVPRFGDNTIVCGFISDGFSKYVGFSVKGDTQKLLIGNLLPKSSTRDMYISDGGNNLFENGTTSNPFKTMLRSSKTGYYLNNVINVILPSVYNSDVTLEGVNINLDSIEFEPIINGNITLINCVVYAKKRIVFNGDITLNNSKMTTYEGSTIRNVTAMNSEFKTCVTNHRGQIICYNSTVDLSMENPSDSLNVNATYNSLVKLNRTNTTGVTIGGGTTLLTPGVK